MIDNASTLYVGVPVTMRNIYMFLNTISTLDVKFSLLRPVRLVMSRVPTLQTMVIMLFAFINSTLQILCSNNK